MNKFRLCLALAGFPALLSGASSINLTPNNVSYVGIPAALPYKALTGYRFEGRITSWSAPGSGFNRILDSSGGGLGIQTGGILQCISFADSTSKAARLSIAALPDFLFRCQRDAANARLTLEVWSADGKNYSSAQDTTAPNPQPVSWSGGLGFGSFSADPLARVSFAYLRWYSAAVPLDSAAPNNSPGTPDLADWEFEGNTHDSSGKIADFAGWSGTTPGYSTTPVYAPSANLVLPPVTIRAGEEVSLDASRSVTFVDNNQLTFVWQQLKYVPILDTSEREALDPAESAVLGTVQWSSQTASVVSATLPLAGTYYFRVTATDATGQTGSKDFVIGTVAADSKGIVIVPDPRMSFLLGPLTIWGSSPWPWYDGVMKANADAMFAPRGVPSTPPFQLTAAGSPGTIALTNSKTNGDWQRVIGTGTYFTTDFACNGTDSIVIYYRLDNGKTGARYYAVTACASDTQMTINQANVNGVAGYDASAPQTGVTYGKVNNAEIFGWTSTTTNWNYYDVVLALYRLYYRTGIDTYLTDARQMADSWWVFPLDGGRVYNSGSYAPQGARSTSLLGMMARAVDGHPERWLDSPATGAPANLTTPTSGIKGMIDVLDFLYIAQSFRDPRVQGSFVDPRETGYTAWFLAAYQYLYDPSYYSHVRDVFLGANSIRSRYSPQYGFTSNADPLFDSAYLTPYGYSGPNNRGSTWLAAFLMKALIAFAETSPVPADRTATLSLVQTSFDTFMSSHYMGGRCQEITYSSNYLSCSSGNMPSDPYLGLPPGSVTATNGNSIITGSGTNFTNLGIFRNDGSDYIGVNIGTGYQMLNIPAGGITSATSLRTNTPFTGTSASGLTYGRGAACPDGTGRSGFPQNTYSTLDEDLADCASPPHYGMGGRTVGELVHQINGYLYYKTGSESYKAQGDALFAAAYGCGTSAKGCLRGGTGLAEGIQGGGPGADAGSGNFGDLLVYPVDSQSARGKEFGSNAGAALADSYLAYRLGGQEQPVSRTVQIGYDAAAVPIGGQVRVSVVQPTGNVVRKVCTATPCGVVVDARMGNHLLKLDYLSPSGAVLASGQPAPLRVK